MRFDILTMIIFVLTYTSTGFANEQPLEPEIALIHQNSKKIINDFLMGSNEKDSLNKEEIDAQLFVLVSFSMPDSLIKQYINEAKKYNGRVVLIGLVENDLKMTQLKLKDLGENIQVDPNLFEMYGIKSVPAIVLTSDNYPCNASICEAGEHDIMFGAVHLKHALDAFSLSGDLHVAAKKLLSRAS